MPQLETQFFLPQIVWLIITFGILYVVMARVALPRIAEVLRARQQRISNDLDEAERLKRETEEVIQAYEKALAEARSQAQALATETRAKANAEATAKREELESQLTAEQEEAEKRIAEARASAMAQVTTVAQEAVGEIVSRLAGLSPDRERVASTVEDVARKGS